ncbi:short-chain dehydrogenase/reductase (SDR) family protein [Tieghemostelium lacteum]|uniref:Short-chain dehydrogenase/reductase (SDR) family protein n=1 Tax=Tieghemostelium lacteum TaxID=361077 RepID=A0A152A4B0_TIELA|nr:short-chain dehydrogenase/reductase (SDR) family protein [Tieghemostelium lacteum]|eukprot:KYR00915.1 short-chain dehydrogenase/reductase (SDR) family protein [Tieghemostelium lacteum]
MDSEQSIINNNNKTTDYKVWFITGASSGIGLQLALNLISQGYSVAGTSRHLSNIENKINSERFLPLEVDLVNEESVSNALKKTVEKFGRVDVIVNNAGQSILGALEEFSDSEIRDLFDSNLFGPLNVIRHSLKYLRVQKSGLIYNISSIAGFMENAMTGGYSATKFALSGVSESLKEELKPFGIQVCSVNPGMVKTAILNKIMYPNEVIADYQSREMLNAFYKYRESINLPGTDADKLAKLLIDVSLETDIPAYLFCGVDANNTSKDKITKLTDTINKNEKRAGIDILESK